MWGLRTSPSDSMLFLLSAFLFHGQYLPNVEPSSFTSGATAGLDQISTKVYSSHFVMEHFFNPRNPGTKIKSGNVDVCSQGSESTSFLQKFLCVSLSMSSDIVLTTDVACLWTIVCLALFLRTVQLFNCSSLSVLSLPGLLSNNVNNPAGVQPPKKAPDCVNQLFWHGFINVTSFPFFFFHPSFLPTTPRPEVNIICRTFDTICHGGGKSKQVSSGGQVLETRVSLLLRTVQVVLERRITSVRAARLSTSD